MSQFSPFEKHESASSSGIFWEQFLWIQVQDIGDEGLLIGFLVVAPTVCPRPQATCNRIGWSHFWAYCKAAVNL